MKTELADQVGIILLRQGYSVKILPRKWFDILARKDGMVLFIKVLHDANSISSELASEMSRLASFIGGAPLIIADKAGEPIEDGIVHSRFGVYTINFITFSHSLNGRLPMILRNQAGPSVSVSGSRLSGSMDEHGYSLAQVSRRIGVSRQMVARYRIGRSQVSMHRAQQMHKLFGDRVFERVDIFAAVSGHDNSGNSQLARKYEDLGFRAMDTKRAPFDIVARLDKEIILTKVGDRADKSVDSLRHLIGTDNLVIYDRKRPADKGTPAIRRAEFLDIRTARELISFLREF